MFRDNCNIVTYRPRSTSRDTYSGNSYSRDTYNGNAYNRGIYNGGTYNGGTYNMGTFNRNAYNRGTYNGSACNRGAYIRRRNNFIVPPLDCCSCINAPRLFYNGKDFHEPQQQERPLPRCRTRPCVGFKDELEKLAFSGRIRHGRQPARGRFARYPLKSECAGAMVRNTSSGSDSNDVRQNPCVTFDRPEPSALETVGGRGTCKQMSEASNSSGSAACGGEDVWVLLAYFYQMLQHLVGVVSQNHGHGKATAKGSPRCDEPEERDEGWPPRRARSPQELDEPRRDSSLELNRKAVRKGVPPSDEGYRKVYFKLDKSNTISRNLPPPSIDLKFICQDIIPKDWVLRVCEDRDTDDDFSVVPDLERSSEDICEAKCSKDKTSSRKYRERQKEDFEKDRVWEDKKESSKCRNKTKDTDKAVDCPKFVNGRHENHHAGRRDDDDFHRTKGSEEEKYFLRDDKTTLARCRDRYKEDENKGEDDRTNSQKHVGRHERDNDRCEIRKCKSPRRSSERSFKMTDPRGKDPCSRTANTKPKDSSGKACVSFERSQVGKKKHGEESEDKEFEEEEDDADEVEEEEEETEEEEDDVNIENEEGEDDDNNNEDEGETDEGVEERGEVEEEKSKEDEKHKRNEKVEKDLGGEENGSDRSYSSAALETSENLSQAEPTKRKTSGRVGKERGSTRRPRNTGIRGKANRASSPAILSRRGGRFGVTSEEEEKEEEAEKNERAFECEVANVAHESGEGPLKSQRRDLIRGENESKRSTRNSRGYPTCCMFRNMMRALDIKIKAPSRHRGKFDKGISVECKPVRTIPSRSQRRSIPPLQMQRGVAGKAMPVSTCQSMKMAHNASIGREAISLHKGKRIDGTSGVLTTNAYYGDVESDASNEEEDDEGGQANYTICTEGKPSKSLPPSTFRKICIEPFASKKPARTSETFENPTREIRPRGRTSANCESNGIAHRVENPSDEYKPNLSRFKGETGYIAYEPRTVQIEPDSLHRISDAVAQEQRKVVPATTVGRLSKRATFACDTLRARMELLGTVLENREIGSCTTSYAPINDALDPTSEVVTLNEIDKDAYGQKAKEAPKVSSKVLFLDSKTLVSKFGPGSRNRRQQKKVDSSASAAMDVTKSRTEESGSGRGYLERVKSSRSNGRLESAVHDCYFGSYAKYEANKSSGDSRKAASKSPHGRSHKMSHRKSSKLLSKNGQLRKIVQMREAQLKPSGGLNNCFLEIA